MVGRCGRRAGEDPGGNGGVIDDGENGRVVERFVVGRVDVEVWRGCERAVVHLIAGIIMNFNRMSRSVLRRPAERIH